MKIAYVYDVIYPYVLGGAEKRCWELAVRLSARGHQVHLFGMKSWEGEDYFIKDGVYIHGVLRHRKLYNPSGVRSFRQVFCFALRILPALWKEDFDIIDCNAFPYLPFFPVKLYCLLKKTPLVTTWQELWGSYWRKYLGCIRGVAAIFIEILVLRLSRNIIAHSVKVQDDLIRRGKPRENVKIIPHGIDLNFIDNTPASAERFDLVFAGRLIKDKNVDLALGALALVKKELGRISFLVIGDGPEKAHLKNLVEELGLSGDVVFGGFVNYKTLISRLKSSRIFLFPSSREGFGIVIIEAKACGLPVIAVRHAMNASTDLITQDKDGLLCAMDSQEISAGILRLMRNPDKLKEMSCAARDSVRDYDWNKIAADSEGLYNSLIRKVQA